MKCRNLRERIVLAERAPGEPFDFGRFEIIQEPFDSPLPDGDDSPIPLAFLARLFDIRPDCRSLWPEETLLRVTRKFAEKP
jgi:hypothetical protein